MFPYSHRCPNTKKRRCTLVDLIINFREAQAAHEALSRHGGLGAFIKLMNDPAFAERELKRLEEDAVIREVLAGYTLAFTGVVEACDFTWWNQERITGANFPGESFEGGDYDLEWQQLGKDCDNADEVAEVVRGWQSKDKTILGGGSAGDGLYLAGEFKAGRRDQPNGWIVCPGSTSVRGGLLSLYRGDAARKADVYSGSSWWGKSTLVLLRKAPRKP